MFLRSVSFVCCEIIISVLIMELLHQFIPVDFRYDGCSSNGDADAVTVDDWLLNSSIKIFYEESIDKDVTGGVSKPLIALTNACWAALPTPI